MTKEEYSIYLMIKERNKEKAHKLLIKYRKRDRAKKIAEQTEQETKIIHSDNESWIEKIVYPFEFSTEEIAEYIENSWMHIYSAYDCTGKTFTRYIKCFPINGKTIIYHAKAIDC